MQGSVRTECDAKSSILRVCVTRVPDRDRYVSDIQDCYSRFDFKHVVWDFQNGSLAAMSAADFKAIAGAGLEFVDKRGAGAKTAVLVASEPEIILIRAFAGMAGLVSPVHFKALLYEDEAMVWISSG